MSFTLPPIGLGFTRAVGKDTLAALMKELDPSVRTYAFATALKADLRQFIRENFGFDVFGCTADQKELIRPLLIAYGMAKRVGDPDYWVKRTISDIRRDLALFDGVRPIVPVVTDVRFENEVRLLRSELGAKIVHVTRIGAPEPTEEEQKHIAALTPLADLQFNWGNDNAEMQMHRAAKLMDRLTGEAQQREAETEAA